MNTIKLTPTQKAIIKAAKSRPDFCIEPLPANINAGIKPVVIESLLKKALIIDVGNKLVLAPKCFAKPLAQIDTDEAAFSDPERVSLNNNTPNKNTTVSTTDRSDSLDKSEDEKPKKQTKLSTLIVFLMQANGSTIDQLCETTGWQKHSVRGALSNLKRAGHNVVSSKEEDGVRRYKIVNETLQTP